MVGAWRELRPELDDDMACGLDGRALKIDARNKPGSLLRAKACVRPARAAPITLQLGVAPPARRGAGM
jgi:hypothetical protein